MADDTSPFRRRLESAAARLEALAGRSSPIVAPLIRREVVAVREASTMLEGEPCGMCDGRGYLLRESDRCSNCNGTGDL